MQPIILRENEFTLSALDDLRKEYNIWKEQDVHEAQLAEVFEIENPALVGKEMKEAQEEFVKEHAGDEKGNWIYYPWSGILVHTVSQELFTRLRTNRNRNLITTEEQDRLLQASIAMTGLSVGSNIATALVYGGIGGHFRLSEFDTLETSNLNRIRARIDQIGMRKDEIIAQQLYEIDPYVQIDMYSDGISKASIPTFLGGAPKPSVVFEVIDSFEAKIHLREFAKKDKIPVIMVTNLGDRILIDVERYDTEQPSFFNGRAGDIPSEILDSPDVTDEQKNKYAVELAGVDHIPERAMASVREIGKTLVGRPQLASSVTIAAGFCAYATKKIVLGKDFPSGSWLIDLDRIVQEDHFTVS